MNTEPNAPDAVQVIPSGGACGAEIRGLDLSQPLPAETVDRVRQAWLDHLVIYLRAQKIEDEDQVRFTNYFGRAVPHVRKQRDRRVKEIFIISNVTEKGEPIGALGNDEISFHSDLSYMPLPGLLSTLYAIEVPETGGQTQWCNCYAAYEALDDGMKQRLDGLRAVHRHYVEDQNPPALVDHPVVCTHPETGRKCLYVGPHLTQFIVGMDAKESRHLLELLYNHVASPEFIWGHDWQVGDLLMWDNRPTMHRREPFPATERRIMKRTQAYCERPPVP